MTSSHSHFATIEEAWGGSAPWTLPPGPNAVVSAVSRNLANAPWMLGGDTLANDAKLQTVATHADRYRFVQGYVARLYATSGVAGVCRLLGQRICRAVRNRYLLKLDAHDVLVLLLVALAGTLLLRAFRS